MSLAARRAGPQCNQQVFASIASTENLSIPDLQIKRARPEQLSALAELGVSGCLTRRP